MFCEMCLFSTQLSLKVNFYIARGACIYFFLVKIFVRFVNLVNIILDDCSLFPSYVK